MVLNLTWGAPEVRNQQACRRCQLIMQAALKKVVSWSSRSSHSKTKYIHMMHCPVRVTAGGEGH